MDPRKAREVIVATERPVLDGRVLIRCTSATAQRIRERKPLHTRAGVTPC